MNNNIQLTPLQMIEKVEDARAVENLMGKLMFLMCYRRHGDAWNTLFSTAEDVTLTLNNGKFIGREAVKSWFVDYQDAISAKANSLMRERYPEELGKLPESETWGAGYNSMSNATTPIVEIAADRKTAKGVWYNYGEMTEVNDTSVAAFWHMGRFAADFLNEDGQWKIWHLQMFDDFITPVGKKYGTPTGQITVSGVEAPAFTVEEEFFHVHDKDRTSPRKPEMPVPYGTFAETFSY